jgi:hypothetical protein
MYLSTQQLHLTFLLYEYFLTLRHERDMNLVMEYTAALAMFAKTDIHLRMEINYFMLFFNVFQQLIMEHEKVEENEDILETGLNQITGMLKERSEYDRNIKLAQAIQRKEKISEAITLKETVAM